MQKVFREIKEHLYFYECSSLNFLPHIHEDIELVFVKQGGGTAYSNGKKYILKEKSFFMVFPNQVHHYSDCSEGKYVVIIVKPDRLLSYNNVFLKGEPVSALIQFEENGDDNIIYILNTALNELERDGYSTVINAYLTLFFGKLLKYYEITESRLPKDSVLQILQYCSAHYNENITVADVAKDLHLSRSSVSHIFSTRFAMNFCDYINSLRLNDATELLKSKNYSVTEISNMSGFSTIRTFNRAFLKRYGITPTEYRKSKV